MDAAMMVSGASGFVGSHLIAGLLQRHRDLVVIGLARPGPGRSARERVVEAVGRAFNEQGFPGGPEHWQRRLVVASGDLLARDGVPGGEALEASRDFRVEDFWHCAGTKDCASLNEAAAWRINVDGLYQALRLAELCGAVVFNQISTAFVAGTRNGRVREVLHPRPPAFHNAFEESKHFGEEMVAHQCRSNWMHHRIFRPSILIGRPTGTPGRGGLGRFLDCAQAFYDAVVARDPAYFERHALKVCASREATINLVRVDQAVAEMIDLSAAGSPTFDQIFHLTGEAPLGVLDLLEALLPMLGIPRFEIAGRDSELGAVDRLFRRSMRFFSPYLHDRKIFDRSNVARFEVEDRWVPILIDLARLRATVASHRGQPITASILDLGLEPGPGWGLDEMVA